MFFAIKVPEVGLHDERQSVAGRQTRGAAVKGVLTFPQAPKTLLLKVGISPVNTANALANIAAEVPGWDFEAVRRAAEARWEQELGKITIETPDPAVRRTFYTALYHAWFAPALFNDAQRRLPRHRREGVL